MKTFMTTRARRNILITGAGSGLGKAFATEAIFIRTLCRGDGAERGGQVGIRRVASGASPGLAPRCHRSAAIGPAVAKLESEVGQIDVLVNNAGYGHKGILEESPLEEIKRQFDVNVFGGVTMMKAMLPHMRKRRRGHIVNVTSMAGYVGLPGIADYAGSKFALEGISRCWQRRFVTSASGNGDRAWLLPNRLGRAVDGSKSAEHNRLRLTLRFCPTSTRGKEWKAIWRSRPGCPSVAEGRGSRDPPVHILLGTDALRLVREKLESLDQEINAWESTTRSTEYA